MLYGTVAPMNLQVVKEFYEKLRYVVDFDRAGYLQNSSCIFMREELWRKLVKKDIILL